MRANQPQEDGNHGKKVILTKTAKGLREAASKTEFLPLKMRFLLKEIDGRTSFTGLLRKLPDWTEEDLRTALERLNRESYVHDLGQSVIFTKTAKGLRETYGKTKNLSRDLRSLLMEIDGQSTLGDLIGKVPDWGEADLQRALEQLASDSYIHELIPEATDSKPIRPSLGRGPAVQADDNTAASGIDLRDDLDFTAPMPAKSQGESSRFVAKEKARREAKAKARREAEERARQEAEERARQEAEEQARREAEEQARQEAEEQARREAEEQARREAEERARREAEERARQEAEEQARREAEERARREAEEQARREAEERARREAEEQARREAEERASREAEEQARREAEERARQEAEERARQEAEERARREAEEQARREAEERARQEAEEQARREAEERARQEAEEQARREAEERARREAEEQARREAEEQARREAEEQARREAEERARREAEERARQEAEERARQEAEERARREAEEQARRKAEERARKEAEKQARREAKAQARREAEESARRKRELRRSAATTHQTGPRWQFHWTWPVLLVLAALVVTAIVTLTAPLFSGRTPDFEKLASEQFQQPVKIQKLHFFYLPQPRWELEGVTIGDKAQIRAARIVAPVSHDAIFDGSVMPQSWEIVAPVISEEGLGWLLFGHAGPARLGLREVSATNVKLAARHLRRPLPVFDATLVLGENGDWRQIDIATEEGRFKARISAGAPIAVRIELQQSALPAGVSPVFEELAASGRVDRGGLYVDEFNAYLFGGSLAGKARLQWDALAVLKGELTASSLDMAQIFPGLMEKGRLFGEAGFALPVRAEAQSERAERLSGSFAIEKGILSGVDFGGMLRGESGNRKTHFNRLTGNIAHQDGKTLLRQLSVDAGKLTAKGGVEVGTQGELHGQFRIDLSLGAERRHASANLSGSIGASHTDLRWD